jgi:hypothetical protein
VYHNTLTDNTSDCRGRTALVKVESSTMTLVDPSMNLIVSAELDANASIFSIEYKIENSKYLGTR